MTQDNPTLVFLHIPKTAGQTVHRQLAQMVGAAAVSPVRVHSQAKPEAQMPPGYRLYSDHIDWTALDTLPENRFVFSVLRDPMERIASFYLYLLHEARALDETELAKPGRAGMRMILSRSADDYFFGGDEAWKVFIRDHYDNFYTTYLATRLMRGWRHMAPLFPEQRIERALAGAAAIDKIYPLTGLDALERDIEARTGKRIKISDTWVNTGPVPRETARWPQLLERFERDSSKRWLAEFARTDRQLMRRLGLEQALVEIPGLEAAD